MFGTQTTSQITASIVAAKKEIAAKALDSNSDSLAVMLLSLAELEGQLTAAEIWEQSLERTGGNQEAAIRGVTRRLFRGADDSWSGRRNDVRRAWFDGYRDAAETFVQNAER